MCQVSSFRSTATLTSGSHIILTIDYAPSLRGHYTVSSLLRAAATRIHRPFPAYLNHRLLNALTYSSGFHLFHRFLAFNYSDLASTFGPPAAFSPAVEWIEGSYRLLDINSSRNGQYCYYDWSLFGGPYPFGRSQKFRVLHTVVPGE